MYKKEFKQAEEHIRKKIFFGLSKLALNQREFQMYPDFLDVKEYKYNKKSYFVLMARYQPKSNSEESFDVPICADANSFENLNNINPILYLHSEKAFIYHTIRELGGKYSITAVYSKKNKCIVLGDWGLIDSYQLYIQYLVDLFFSPYGNDKSFGDFKELAILTYLSKLLTDDLMFLEKFVISRDIYFDQNAEKLEEVNNWILEEIGEDIFHKLVPIVNNFADKYGYVPVTITENNEHVEAQRKYTFEHGYNFATEIVKFLQDTPFLELLNKFSAIELLALVTMSDSKAKSKSLLIITYVYSKKRNSVYLTSAINSLFRIKHTEMISVLRVSDETDETKELAEWKHLFDISESQLKSEFNALLNYVDHVNPSSDAESLDNLIRYGESKTLEFKATAKYSIDAKADDKNLYYPIIKSICAFANTDGGTLIVGFDERSNNFIGIEKDGFKNIDMWENYIRNHLDQKAGKYIGTLFEIDFKDYESKTIALIHVTKSTKRIHCGDLTNPKAQKFFVRTGAYTKALELEEAIEFINNRNLE